MIKKICLFLPKFFFAALLIPFSLSWSNLDYLNHDKPVALLQLEVTATDTPISTTETLDTRNTIDATITLTETPPSGTGTPTLQPTYTLYPTYTPYPINTRQPKATSTPTLPESTFVGLISESPMIFTVMSLQCVTLLLILLLIKRNKVVAKQPENPRPSHSSKESASPESVNISRKTEEILTRLNRFEELIKSNNVTADNKSAKAILETALEELPQKSGYINTGSTLSEGENINMPIKSGFVSVATRSKTRSEDENQDSGRSFQTDFVRVAAVADGVGSAKNSKIASQQLVDYFINIASDISTKLPQNHESRIRIFYNNAVEKISNALSEKGLPLNSASTTFIGVVENANHYIVTYLADGSIFRVRQSLKENKFVVDSMLMNLSSPDVPQQISAKGKTISPEIHKIIQNEGGDMWIIATDGMNDFNPNKDKAKPEEFITKFANEIWQAYKENPEKFESILQSILLRWVKLCQTTDDATVAVLISGEMKSQWDKLISLQ